MKIKKESFKIKKNSSKIKKEVTKIKNEGSKRLRKRSTDKFYSHNLSYYGDLG